MAAEVQKIMKNEQLTSAILVLANLTPLVGVVSFQWDLQTIMLLYWIENLIVGLINIVRIVFLTQASGVAQRLGSAAFFTMHYGLFCMAHGSLLLSLLNIEIAGLSGTISPIQMVENFPEVYLFLQQVLGGTASIALLGMLLSHGFSLKTHYFKAGEQHRLTVPKAMKMPYQRIVVMHIGLMAGVFLLESFGAPVLLLVALIVTKIAVDFLYHRKEHKGLRENKEYEVLD